MIKWGVSTRHDGNMGLHVGDDPLKVTFHRETFLSRHGLTLDSLVTANQVHSDAIYIVTHEDRSKGSFDHSTAITNCDALITSTENITLGIVTADCVPVLLWDQKKNVIAAIHAGWKGTAKKITQKTASLMTEHYNCHPEDIHAFIAPAIGVCCYEVKEDTALACGCGGLSHLDLKQLNYDQLLTLGLLPHHIILSPICTSCDNSTYFSHRADHGHTGRTLSFISL